MRAGFYNLKKISVLFTILLLSVIQVFSQEDTISNDGIDIYVDCRGCDMDYIKDQMPYVNFMRDVKEADVYLLVTQLKTGSGGQDYTLFYNGEEEFTGMKDTLKFVTSPDDTRDVIREGLARTMQMGLMRYVAKTPIMQDIRVNYNNGQVKKESVQPKDKWNNWVFSLSTRPRMNIEKSREEYSISNTISVSRVTEDWKIEFDVDHRYNKNIFTYTFFNEELGDYVDASTETYRKSWSNSGLVVKSISDHWSVGLRTELSSSTYQNIDLRTAIYPSIEYDLFPYSESNQRQLRFLYGVGHVYHDYIETTLYNVIEENLIEQKLDIAFEVQQKWGNINVSVGASNYFHDLSKNKVEVDGFLTLRLFKGFSLSINGGVALIHNQIELPKAGMNETDLYLNLKELETNFRYDGSVGITYTFGSMYNNVVNPRFQSGGGSRMFFF